MNSDHIQLKKSIVSLLIQKKILVSDELIHVLNDPELLERLGKEVTSADFDVNLVFQWVAKKEKIPTVLFNPLEVVFSYKDIPRKRECRDFVSYLNARYEALQKMLQQRQELQGLTSISRVLEKKDKDTLAVIAMVNTKEYTKQGNLILTVEDPTGMIKVLVNKTKQDLFTLANDLVLDEVVGIIGKTGDRIIFANAIIFPDVPLTKELKKGPDDVYAIFLSDVHVGSKYFLRENLERFIRWISGEEGTDEQKAIASKIGYVFVVGDLIDGVGIYPGQENELLIKDVKDQYAEFAKIFSGIPHHIKLIICPGNHDAVRLSEPQLELYHEFAQPLWDMPNAVLVTNPALINIARAPDFPGFDILVYHGYSFDYYASHVGGIRNNGGYERGDLIMKFLLQRRHLAPTHTSTLYIPYIEKDALIIHKVPDIFATGHIHKSAVANYRNITLISGSCWQSTTAFQEKVGHKPEPCKVPIVNLKTRHVTVLNFGDEQGYERGGEE